MLIPSASPGVVRGSLTRPMTSEHGIEPSQLCIACGVAKCNDGTSRFVFGLGNGSADAATALCNNAQNYSCGGNGGLLQCVPVNFGCCGDNNYP
jgi:hypothetical protein